MRLEDLRIGDIIEGDQNRIGQIYKMGDAICYYSHQGNWFLTNYEAHKARKLTPTEIKEFIKLEDLYYRIEKLKDINETIQSIRKET